MRLFASARKSLISATLVNITQPVFLTLLVFSFFLFFLFYFFSFHFSFLFFFIWQQRLEAHLRDFSNQYSHLVAFRPTGWSHRRGSHTVDLDYLRPSERGSVSVFGVPYSEHSSFSELERFVVCVCVCVCVSFVIYFQVHFRFWHAHVVDRKLSYFFPLGL